MGIKEAIDKGNKQYQGGLDRHRSKLSLRPLTAQGLLTYFNVKFQEADLGEPPMVSKKDTQMLRGFLRLLKNNEKDDDWTRSLVSDMIEHWDDLRRLEFTTLKGKPWTLAPRPNITDFLICHKSMVANVEFLREESLKEQVAVTTTKVSAKGEGPAPATRPTRKTKFDPTEFDAEMEGHQNE